MIYIYIYISPIAFGLPATVPWRNPLHKKRMKQHKIIVKTVENNDENALKSRFGGVPEALGGGLGAIWAPRAIQDSKIWFVVHFLCTPRLTQEVQNRAKIIKKLNEKLYDF